MNRLPDLLRFLVVDDHPLVRLGLRAVLQAEARWGPIDEAGSAAEAVAQAAAHLPDLVLLDLHLPGPSGLEVIRLLRAQHPHLKVIMVAAEPDPEAVRAALEAGAVGFLSKTLAMEYLLPALERVLEGGVFLCPEAEAALTRADACRPVDGAGPAPSVLSAREREVLQLFADGENTKAIAARLGISPKTVETHRSHLLQKLRTSSVVGLTRYAIRHGLVQV